MSFAKSLQGKKILVLGGCTMSDVSIQKMCKKYGLNKRIFEFVEYAKIKVFDFEKLLDSNRYSDIFIGSTPHKARNISGSTSVVQFLENNRESLPQITQLKLANGSYGFSLNNFENALLNSNYLENRHKNTTVQIFFER